jgi:alkyldihydroxyacetonephosphate synthase
MSTRLPASETALAVVEMHPYRWGDPAHPSALPESAQAMLGALGIAPPERGPVDPADIALPAVGLPVAVHEALDGLLGAEHVRTDQAARVGHTRGCSTPDVLRLRAGDAADAPDAVVYPGTHDEVLAVLRLCSEHRVAVVPYAGGTSVVGGLAPVREGFAAVVTVDVRRLDAMTAIDEVSRTATLQAGVRATAAEALLAAHGYTLGHFPQSYEGASIGGYAATRSSGQSSAGFGRFDEMVVGVTLATPTGTIELGAAPMSASGPDLRQLVIGSEGALGIITAVTVRFRRAPEVRVFEGWRFPDFTAGAAALRRLVQDGPEPTVLRLSDEVETAVNLADPSEAGAPTAAGGCLMICGYEGAEADVTARRAGATSVLLDAGGEPLGEEPGEAWREGRFRGPYLRDPLLDAGGFVETLETVTFWSNVPALKQRVTDALTRTLGRDERPVVVMCHISHVYETGASLYFTVLSVAGDDPLGTWRPAKAAACDAIRACGAAITHHHAVGTDHRPWFEAEVGPLAVASLRAVKRTLDPQGILNPGVLISAEAAAPA